MYIPSLSFSQKEQLYAAYTEILTERRKNLFETIILSRMRHLTVVLEDIYQSQNASAVIRSCDCFGIQDLHVIENRNAYEINPDVAVGSSKWINLNQYNRTDENTLECFDHLRSQGYQIIATAPNDNHISIQDLDISKKTALVFGTEHLGLSETALKHADGFTTIPMYGFTESFNISVSVALSLQYLTDKIRNSSFDWQLSPEEQLDIKLEWSRRTVKDSKTVEKIISERLNLA